MSTTIHHFRVAVTVTDDQFSDIELTETTPDVYIVDSDTYVDEIDAAVAEADAIAWTAATTVIRWGLIDYNRDQQGQGSAPEAGADR